MKKAKRLLSLFIVTVMVVSMFSISNVTSSAYGGGYISPNPGKVDKALTNTIVVTVYPDMSYSLPILAIWEFGERHFSVDRSYRSIFH